MSTSAHHSALQANRVFVKTNPQLNWNLTKPNYNFISYHHHIAQQAKLEMAIWNSFLFRSHLVEEMLFFQPGK